MTFTHNRRSALIADDDPVARTLLKGYLNRRGFQVTDVENGKDALDVLESSFENKTPFKLVCLDIKMPDIDGLEVLNKIREIEKSLFNCTSERIPVLIVTSFGSPDYAEKAFYQGDCQGFLQKPIDQKMVTNALSASRLI
jgi:two-component system, chemotaxis family, chemotaxis protein CheY